MDASAWLVFLAVVVVAIAAMLARFHWACEIVASFRWYLGLAAVLVAAPVVLLLGRRPHWRIAGCLAIGAWASGPEALLWLHGPEQARGRKSIELLVANVLHPNKRWADFIDLVEREDPDVVAMLEVSLRWRRRIDDALRDRYPHRLLSVHEDDWEAKTWGVALYSKSPLADERVVHFEEIAPPRQSAIEARLEFDGAPLVLQVSHPPRVGRGWRMPARDLVLSTMAERRTDHERVWVGDFNLTSTSPFFGSLLKTGDLFDSRRGFGRQPTWSAAAAIQDLHPPDWVKHLGTPKLAIDHALVSRGLDVLDRRVLSVVGSDHKAIVIRLARK